MGFFFFFFVTAGQDQSNYLNSGKFFLHFRVTSRLPEIYCRKKTFNKSLGGAMAPLAPPPGYATDLSYDDRLKECGLTTLETRRLRGDQIEVFKILNGHENIDPNIFFKIKTGKITRGHDFTLVKGQNRLDFRKHSFSQ